MKWYEHRATDSTDHIVVEAVKKFGLEAYAVRHILREVLSRHDCVLTPFKTSISYLETAFFPLKFREIRRILGEFRRKSKIFFEVHDSSVELLDYDLRDLVDEYMKKQLKRQQKNTVVSGQNPDSVGTVSGQNPDSVGTVSGQNPTQYNTIHNKTGQDTPGGKDSPGEPKGPLFSISLKRFKDLFFKSRNVALLTDKFSEVDLKKDFEDIGGAEKFDATVDWYIKNIASVPGESAGAKDFHKHLQDYAEQALRKKIVNKTEERKTVLPKIDSAQAQKLKNRLDRKLKVKAVKK